MRDSEAQEGAGRKPWGEWIEIGLTVTGQAKGEALDLLVGISYGLWHE